MSSALLSAALLVGVLAGGPKELALPGYRVHVVASEDLDPDRLRALAREGTVLWLRTRSNLLRSSTVETVALFPSAWIELRSPVSDEQVRQLARAPSAGVWADSKELAKPGWHRLGGRPLAVRVAGPLDDAAVLRLERARPRWTEWAPAGAVDLLSWGTFAQLPGAKLLDAQRLGGAEALASRCGGPAGRAGAIQLWVDPAGVEAAARCGLGARVRVHPRLTDERLSAIFLRHPGAELQVEVGADEGLALATSALLARLEAAAPRGGKGR